MIVAIPDELVSAVAADGVRDVSVAVLEKLTSKFGKGLPELSVTVATTV